MSDDRFERDKPKRRWERSIPEYAPDDQQEAIQRVEEVFGACETESYSPAPEREPEKYKVLSNSDKLTLEKFLYQEFDAGRERAPYLQVLAKIFHEKNFREIYLRWRAERGKK